MSLLPLSAKTVQWSAACDVSIDGLGNLPADPLNVLGTINKSGNNVAYVGSSNCTINATSQFIWIFLNCWLLSIVRYCSWIRAVLETNVQATSSRYCRCCGAQKGGNNRCSSASGKFITYVSLWCILASKTKILMFHCRETAFRVIGAVLG